MMLMNLFPDEEIREKVMQHSFTVLESIVFSLLSFRQMTYQVFLSFRGEDTRRNFTSHLLKALKDKGIYVFFDEEELEKGGELLPTLSKAIEDSIISVIVLSKDYASSKSCLVELSHIMSRKHVEKHVVVPIFYHVDPSDVRNIRGSFRKSFDGHESKRLPQVQQWKKAFAEIGELKGWHIEGGKFDRSETEYIRDIVEDVIKKLNSKSRSVFEGLVGIDYQKETILRLIEQKENRVIGLWGMAGIGKTTLAEAVYNDMSEKFDAGCFVQNVREKIEKKGMESLRDDLLSSLLDSIICIGTPSIGSPLIQQRLKHKKVIVVLDDVDDSDHIVDMGIEHFGPGSKIVVTCRDKQVLTIAGADTIHKVGKLNEKDSLQLFSTFAFKQLNPAIKFRDLSNKFLEYAQGNPLGLKVLGSQLFRKSREYWESELEKLGEYSKPRILKILQRSFDGLDEIEKNMFLDIAVFFKWEPKDTLEAIFSCTYKGAKSGIENLVDKCLIEVTSREEISMHDMLEEMGKDIARRDEKCKRLWNPQQVGEVLRNNQTDLIEGINLNLDVVGSENTADNICEVVDNLKRFHPAVFEKMHNLKYIDFHCWFFYILPRFRVLADVCKELFFNVVEGDDNNIHLRFSDELRLLRWHCCPYTSFSSSFNPKNLFLLNLSSGDFEQLWSEDVALVKLREFDVSDCKNLRKIPNLPRAEKLKILKLKGCSSLVELPCLNHLASLDQRLELDGCSNLKKFPELPNHISFLSLAFSGIEEVPDSIEHLVRLKMLVMAGSQVKKVSSNISKLESLHRLDLRGCPITEFPEISRSSTRLDLSFTPIRKLQCNIPMSDLETCRCEGLELRPENSTFLRRMDLDVGGQKSPFNDQMFYDRIPSLVYSTRRAFVMMFANCFSLNQDSVDYIVADAMFKIERLAEEWTRTNAQPERREILYLPLHAYVEIYSPFFSTQRELVYCFPSNMYSANKFKNRRVDSSIGLKISPNAGGGSRFLAFYIFVVVDFTNTHEDWISSACTCEYKLKTIGGSDHENFKSVWHLRYDGGIHPDIGPWKCEGNHVLILFSEKMIQKDKNYEKAYFRIRFYSKDHEMEVKHCGVNVYYLDEEPSSSTQT